MENPPCDMDALYEKYSRRLFHTSLRIVGDAMEAEEVMHDTLLKWIRQQPAPATPPQREAWLVKTCVRASIDRLRRRRGRLFSLDDPGAGAEKAVERDVGSGWSDLLNDRSVETADKVRRIKAGIESLPDRYRLILSLLLFEGYDYAEIAGITGLRVSSVRSQYVRGKAKLLKRLRNHG